jgi:hypothetical protein
MENNRKVLCLYHSQYYDLATKISTNILDVANLSDILEQSAGYTDIVFLGFAISADIMEKLYMDNKKQILCIDLYDNNHPLLSLAITKANRALLNYTGKWAILLPDYASIAKRIGDFTDDCL